MALDVDAICVVPSFVFAFFLCVTALCFACFDLLFLPFAINFIHYSILLYTCALKIFAVKTT